MGNNTNSETKEKFKSKIGGQALVEGIMMLGPNTGAMACRLPDGTIDLETWEENNGKNAPWYRKVPLVRGCTSFVISLVKGYKYMMKSAEKQMVDDEDDDKKKDTKNKKSDVPEKAIADAEAAAEAAADTDIAENKADTAEKAENSGEKKTEKEKDTVTDIFMYLGILLGVAMAIGLFVFLPKWLVGLIPSIKEHRIVRSLLEGIVKIVLFVLYMYLVSLMKDIKRQYMYHGAEHKTIACHEAELPLTVENVRKQTRFHKRCGTSFIFIVLIVSILVMCLVPFTVTWQRIVASLVLLPLVVGISYECIRLAGNNDNTFTRILSAPGLAMQRITTREPDDSMIEIAIAAMKPCIPEDKEEDKW
ncbi:MULTISPECIES: DUF1385 domain-containing protein [Ruminococcus]|uniref:Uncharacterized conserved protein YqhQ n=1 Tax=Ruminococcus flavefaciens TaxID=1265 RepID=A0A1M7GJY9_RUMFL|nr:MULTISPECIES: DUF1385 domain-containing protein [Ruminococcus]MCR4795907.1 DUF1385 domain-containing protein [Ruminococcus sp.]SHM16448.1 Uncharacterized conserved protein YqhQ [Ruminococcus flavefaciens]